MMSLLDQMILQPPSKSKRPTRYWAIGFKGWVEVRSHPSQPKAMKSVVEAEVECPEVELIGDRYGIVTHKRKREFYSIAYRGGKVLKTITLNKFYRLTRHTVGVGNIRELTAEEYLKVKKSKGYGYEGE